MAKSILEHYEELVSKSLDSNLYSHTSDYQRALGSALKQAPVNHAAFDTPTAQTDKTTVNTPQNRPLAVQPARALNTSAIRPDAGNLDGKYLGGSQYSPSSQFAPIASAGQGAVNSFDVFAIANWARNIAQEFGVVARPGQTDRTQGIVKGLSFTAGQFLLASFNPGDLNVGGRANQVYNPLSLPLSLVPGIRGATSLASPNAAAALSVTGDVYSLADTSGAPDRLLLMRKGGYVKARSATDLLQFNTITPQHIGDIAAPAKGKSTSLPIAIEGQVDQTGITAPDAIHAHVHKNIYTSDRNYSRFPIAPLPDIESDVKKGRGTAQELKLAALFDDAKAQGNKYSWYAKANTTLNPISYADAPNNWSAEFPLEDASDGTIPFDSRPHDSENYMPFFFQDLRDASVKLLYFRAFLKEGLQETFTPSWQSENYYGRVDEVPTYQSTSRSISLSFDVVAFSPRDLSVIWTKLHKLQSMVYPLYDTNGFIKSGPLIRMRVGDLICGNKSGTEYKKGLPGYINTLDFSYDDGIWNITENMKVPRKISVSLGFTVIHDGNPGIYPFLVHTTSTSATEQQQDKGTTSNYFGAMTVTSVPNRNDQITMNVAQGDVRGVVDTIINSPPEQVASTTPASIPSRGDTAIT